MPIPVLSKLLGHSDPGFTANQPLRLPRVGLVVAPLEVRGRPGRDQSAKEDAEQRRRRRDDSGFLVGRESQDLDAPHCRRAGGCSLLMPWAGIEPAAYRLGGGRSIP